MPDREAEAHGPRPQAARVADSIRPLVTGDLRAAFGRVRLEEKVPRWLDSDESVLALALCTLAGRWWQELRPAKNGRLIVATDRRLRLLPQGTLLARDLAGEARYPDPVSLLYSEILGIEEELGRIESKLNILMQAQTVRLTSMRAKRASAVAEVVRAHT